MKKLKAVHISTSGMIMVFDENGKQIPNLQGNIFEGKLKKIGRLVDKDTKFRMVRFRKGEQELVATMRITHLIDVLGP